MIEISTPAMPRIPAVSRAIVAGAVAGAAPVIDFARALTSLLLPGSDGGAKAGDGGDARPDDAATGKDLPDTANTTDPLLLAMAWPLPPAPPLASAPALPLPVATLARGVVDDPAPVPDTAATGPVGTTDTLLPITDGAPAPTTPAKIDLAAVSKVPAPAPLAATLATALPAPVIPPLETGIASAIFARALAQVDMPDDTRTPGGAPTQPLAALITGTPDTILTSAVRATSDVQQGALDMRSDQWMRDMIDRIDSLRDADSDGPEPKDTRIRLNPGALGSIEIAIRRDGDQTRYHFTADVPATRALLADAAPRLAELAEARGLKLGQPVFDSGTGAGSDRPRDTPPRTTAAMLRTPRITGAPDDTPDTRIA